MKNVLVILILFVGVQGFGQDITFLKSYGDSGYDYGRDVKQDLDTGYICTGSSSSFNSSADAFLMKVDSVGNFIWSHNYGGEGIEWGESVVLTADQNYALCGYSNDTLGSGGFDFYLVKADQSGSPIFEKTYGGSDWDKSYDLASLPDSGFVLVGETYSYGSGLRDAYIVRTDKNGDTLWTYTYGGVQDDFLNAVIFDGDSIVAVGGTASSGAGGTDGLILKLSLDGNLGWAHVTGDTLEDYFNAIDYHGTYYLLSGLTTTDYANYKEDAWTYKVENDLSVVYVDYYFDSGPEYEEAMDCMVRDVNEDIVTSSFTFSYGINDGFGDMIFDKYSPSFIWVGNTWYGANGYDKPWAMDETNDDGFIAIADVTLGSTGGQNFALIKMNAAWDWIDFYNDITFEQVTTAIPIEENYELKIYPTLVNEQINISSNETVQLIRIHDLNGNLVYSSESNQNLINVGHLSSGIYIIDVLINNQLYSQKFAKN